MDEWAKVVVYPLGFCGFSLFLLWRIHVHTTKTGKAPPFYLPLLAGVSLFAGLGLAFLQLSTSGSLDQRPGERRETPVSQASLSPETTQARPALPDPPPQRRSVIDLNGAWQEEGGSEATITQTGRSLAIKIPMVEIAARALGMDSRALTYNGSLEDCPDGEHLAHAELSTPAGVRLSLRLLDDGQRLEGTLANGFSIQRVVMTRH